MDKRIDRTWPLPERPWMMRMTWSDLLFAHWQVDPTAVAKLLPSGLRLDTRQGMAWIGVVPFLMSNVRPRCCPPFPGMRRFLELNVRTYVTVDDKPGVWFFSLEAESWLAVRAARALVNLPYMDASMSLRNDEAGYFRYRSQRTHRGEPAATLDVRYRADGEAFQARPGSLEHWLTARYCFYCIDRKGHLSRGEIDHSPWTLSNASYSEDCNTMGDPHGFRFIGPPHLLFAHPIDVRAWNITQC
jgi:uncharacterized protein